MQISCNLNEDEQVTPIGLAKAVSQSGLLHSLDDFDTFVQHLNIELIHFKREEYKRKYQGCTCAQDE